MQKISLLIISFIISVFIVGCGTHKPLSSNVVINKGDVYDIQLITDTIFNSKQKICLLALHKKSLNKTYTIEIAYDENNLIKTSRIAMNNDALAAINGGFFNMTDGGSVSYFEINDSVIGKTRDPKLKWGVTNRIINGAIILTKNKKLRMELAKTEGFYMKSKKESFVFFTGPLLISNSKFQSLPDMKFSSKRHPRTCLGITKDSIIFVTIDGRSKQAHGMSLIELQKYMHNMGCTDAINLDGGGSTTMWTKNKGIVNSPSDKNGERRVANALVIIKK